MFGIDCYALTGFKQASQSFLDFAETGGVNFTVFTYVLLIMNHQKRQIYILMKIIYLYKNRIDPKVIGMTVTLGILTIIGIVIQYRINKGKSFKKEK